jgi:hypothetical protein
MSPADCNSVPGGIDFNFSASAPPFPWPFAHPEDAVVHAMKNIWGAQPNNQQASFRLALLTTDL